MTLEEVDSCASASASGRRQKSAFSAAEDIELTNLVRELGDANWHVIQERLPGRSARQCRERWNLYLSPNVVNEPWTANEDLQLIQLYQILGPRWTMIAKHFGSRTANSVKNRQKQLQRKVQRLTRFGGGPLIDPRAFGTPPIGFPGDTDAAKNQVPIIVPISQDLSLGDLPPDSDKPDGV
jgi:hypothetical protein